VAGYRYIYIYVILPGFIETLAGVWAQRTVRTDKSLLYAEGDSEFYWLTSRIGVIVEKLIAGRMIMKFSAFYKKPRVRYRTQKISLLDPILTQINLAHNFTPHAFVTRYPRIHSWTSQAIFLFRFSPLSLSVVGKLCSQTPSVCVYAVGRRDEFHAHMKQQQNSKYIRNDSVGLATSYGLGSRLRPLSLLYNGYGGKLAGAWS
jgi:hypothetical protein